MKHLVVAAIAGVLFALGLVVSGMASPARVVAFLDLGSGWDPSLAFAMVAAIAVYAPVARWARGLRAPLFDTHFHLPAATAIDARLVGGAALFGVGWGLSGYCPGPALVSLGAGTPAILVFVAALVAGIALARTVAR